MGPKNPTDCCATQAFWRNLGKPVGFVCVLVRVMGRGGKCSGEKETPKNVKKDGNVIKEIDVKNPANYRDGVCRAACVGKLWLDAHQYSKQCLDAYWDMLTYNHATNASIPSCYPSFEEFMQKHSWVLVESESGCSSSSQPGIPNPDDP